MRWLLSLVLWTFAVSILILLLPPFSPCVDGFIFPRTGNHVEGESLLMASTNTRHVSKDISYHLMSVELLGDCPHIRDARRDPREVCWLSIAQTANPHHLEQINEYFWVHDMLGWFVRLRDTAETGWVPSDCEMCPWSSKLRTCLQNRGSVPRPLA